MNNNNDNKKPSILEPSILDFKREFPHEEIDNTIKFFKKNYSMTLDYIEDEEDLKEYNNIENNTLNDVINYYLFVTPDNGELKCEIVIILKKTYSSRYVKNIEYIVLFENNISLNEIKKFNSPVEYEKKTLITDVFKNSSISKIKMYRIKNYETITYLPKNIVQLDKIVVDVNEKNGCIGQNCTVMGGKKSKRKLARKSMRKSKKKSKKSKKSKK